jgi:hypothetical protein
MGFIVASLVQFGASSQRDFNISENRGLYKIVSCIPFIGFVTSISHSKLLAQQLALADSPEKRNAINKNIKDFSIAFVACTLLTYATAISLLTASVAFGVYSTGIIKFPIVSLSIGAVILIFSGIKAIRESNKRIEVVPREPLQTPQQVLLGVE